MHPFSRLCRGFAFEKVLFFASGACVFPLFWLSVHFSEIQCFAGFLLSDFTVFSFFSFFRVHPFYCGFCIRFFQGKKTKKIHIE